MRERERERERDYVRKRKANKKRIETVSKRIKSKKGAEKRTEMEKG